MAQNTRNRFVTSVGRRVAATENTAPALLLLGVPLVQLKKLNLFVDVLRFFLPSWETSSLISLENWVEHVTC